LLNCSKSSVLQLVKRDLPCLQPAGLPLGAVSACMLAAAALDTSQAVQMAVLCGLALDLCWGEGSATAILALSALTGRGQNRILRLCLWLGSVLLGVLLTDTSSLLLAAGVTLGVVPLAAPAAQAASWLDPYLETMVEWGVLVPDAYGNLNEQAQLTRADFVAMVNRAFGYTEVGPNPFSDVPEDAWYAEDICIAHKAGYFNGTTTTTASPEALVTREQAAVLLARNLRLQGGSGEVLDFTDSREMGNWSRGLVQEAAR